MSLNRVILTGNLGADADLRASGQGTPVSNFRLATEERYVDSATGERRKKVEWHSCVLWGSRAEKIAPLLTKGREVTVEGSLSTVSWTDKDDIKRYRTQVKVQRINLGRLPRPKQEAPEASESDAQEVLAQLEKEEK